MTKYKCVNACIWLGQYWKKGAIYEGDKTPPYHFVSLTSPSSSTTPPLTGEAAPTSSAKPAKAKSAKNEKEPEQAAVTEIKAGE